MSQDRSSNGYWQSAVDAVTDYRSWEAQLAKGAWDKASEQGANKLETRMIEPQSEKRHD